MREILIVAGLFGALAALASLVLVPWDTLLPLGTVLIAAGLALGVPTGLVYHVQLYRALRRKGAAAKGWIWKPFALHDRLDPGDRISVMPWAYAGGLGFLVVVMGQVILASAVLRFYVG